MEYVAAMADAGSGATEEGVSPHVLHSITDCRKPPQGIVTHKDPVASFNSGTPSYDCLGIQALVDSMDLPGLASRFLANSRKREKDQRGNFQIGFGLASCVNVAPPTEPKLLLKYRGVSVPRLLVNTKEEEVLQAMRCGFQIGRLVGVRYCQDGFFKPTPGRKDGEPQRKHVMDMIEDLIGEEGHMCRVHPLCSPLGWFLPGSLPSGHK